MKIARELLTPSGSVFVQISDENVHHVREVMDEVFGNNNFVSEIVFSENGKRRPLTCWRLLRIIILWYAKGKDACKFRQVVHDQAGARGSSSRTIRLSSRTLGGGPSQREEKADLE